MAVKMGRESAQVDDKNKMMDRSGHCFIFFYYRFCHVTHVANIHLQLFIKYLGLHHIKNWKLYEVSWLGIFLWAYVYLPDFTYKVNDSLQGFLEFNSKWHFKHAWLLSEFRLYMHDTTKYNKAWHSNENKW